MPHLEIQVVCFSQGYVDPLMEVLSTMSMRSCLTLPHATVADSGNYICHIQESVQGHAASASAKITVLGETDRHTQT